MFPSPDKYKDPKNSGFRTSYPYMAFISIEWLHFSPAGSSPRSMAAIEFVGVHKRLGGVDALQGLDLRIDSGEVVALVGPNGSGKTTALNLLQGLVAPTSGQATVRGHDTWSAASKARRHVGVVPEGAGVYDRLTGRRHVAFAARSRGAEVDPLASLDRVGLVDVADRRAGTYSRGMKQRLVVAMALVGRPDVLLLDEPFYGLDPDAAATLRSVVREEQERGATVCFATHLFREVDAVADRVAMLSGGRLVQEGPVSTLAEGSSTVDGLASTYRDVVEPEVTA